MDLKELTARLNRPLRKPSELESVAVDASLYVGCEAAREDLVMAIKSAIAIEFYTIPIYLQAFWSVKDGGSDVAKTVREIAIEEMFHLGLACNMFVAVTSESLNLHEFVPSYPSEAPAGARPGLTINLRKLDREQASQFAKLEAFDEGGDVDTIGEFYQSLQNRFDQMFEFCDLKLETERQIESGNDLFELTTKDDVKKAIDIIVSQGEGHPSSGSPYEDPDDPSKGYAHFFQFSEIAKGMKYVPVGDGQFEYDPEQEVEIPEVHEIADHPSGGYNLDELTESVREKFNQFDSAFKGMLDTMNSAWSSGNSDLFVETIGTMFQLTFLARSLMQTPVPESDQFYAPHFRA